ncbi:hypothetical protein MY11210_008288 [Beauveria gryllotalpidicola]
MLLGLASAGPTSVSEPQVQRKAPWNLRAISHRARLRFPSVTIFRNFKYYYQYWISHEEFYAYVIDSGVRVSHQEFEGRAENLWTAIKTSDNEDDFEDKDGHGTHIAGIIAAKTYGVAKTARVVAVRAVDEEGWATMSTLIKALQEAISDIAEKDRHNNAVINMSVGKECSETMNTVIKRAYNRRDASNRQAGILIVTCAGNEGVNAAECSPASSRKAITVGAIEPTWDVASWSNFGSKVDIFAPGVDITSLISESDSAIATKSGTSMAAAHVAALALNAMAVFGKTSNQVREFLLEETSTKDKIQGDLRGAPNRLVNNNNSKQDSCERKDPKNESEDDEC